jgi:hypothetical protein
VDRAAQHRALGRERFAACNRERLRDVAGEIEMCDRERQRRAVGERDQADRGGVRGWDALDVGLRSRAVREAPQIISSRAAVVRPAAESPTGLRASASPGAARLAQGDRLQ